MTTADTHDALLRGLRSQIHDVVDAHLPAGARVAYLNFPNHRNAGDDAIWLAGERAVAGRGRRIRYRAAWNSLSAPRLDAALGADGWIVLNGGGNFGDLYPGGQQALRERVLAEWRDHRILQLGQSLHFQDPAEQERVGRLVSDHGGVTILCRDEPSVAIAQQWSATVAYCPDLAFLVGPFVRPEPQVDIVWLGRSDGERRHERPAPADDLRLLDWLGDVDGLRRWSAPRRAARRVDDALVGQDPSGTRWNSHPLASRLGAATFGPVARSWVDRGVEILGQGRVVVTDRLHAHVLAWLAGIPSVVLDNSYGKVHNVIQLTTGGSPLTHLAGSTEEALHLARTLVRDAGPGRLADRP